jgi:predicted dehydrogenase
MKPLKTAVIGVGVGRLHIESYQELPGAELVAICDSNPARLAEIGDRFGVTQQYTDFKQLYQSGSVDAVSIALPNSLHAPAAIAALKAGLHVLCEKPLADQASSGKQIMAAVEQASGNFMICLNRRYRPDVQWMKQQVESGRLGHIYQVNAGWVRETGIPGRGWFVSKQAAGGGPLIDLGVHMLDLVMWLLGYPKPLTVSGNVQAMFGPRNLKTWNWPGESLTSYEVEDSAVAFIRLENNTILNLETSWASHAKPGMDDFFVTLMGTEGSIHLYVANYTGENTLTQFTELNGAPVTIKPHIVNQKSDHYYAVAEFVDSVRNNLPSPAPAAEGLTILQIIEAIYQSADQGREVTLG